MEYQDHYHDGNLTTSTLTSHSWPAMGPSPELGSFDCSRIFSRYGSRRGIVELAP